MSTRPPEAHDVLVIPRLLPTAVENANGPKGMLKMSVQPDGEYAKSVIVDATDEGARKVYGIARPGAPDNDAYGPAFAILPIRPDPGSQSDTCFLINTENLFLPNPWTAADWDAFDVSGAAGPGAPEPSTDVPANPAWSRTTPPFLIAGPEGKVYLVDVGANRIVELPDLRLQTAIWTQLREGLVVGTVVYEGRVTALFNIASLNLARVQQSSSPPSYASPSTSPSNSSKPGETT
jgi:hypothetical protein